MKLTINYLLIKNKKCKYLCPLVKCQIIQGEIAQMVRWPVKKIQVVMSSNPGMYTMNPGQEFNYHAETRLSDTLQLYG